MTSIRSIRKRGQAKVRDGIRVRRVAAYWRMHRMIKRYNAGPRYVVPCAIDDPRGGVRW